MTEGEFSLQSYFENDANSFASISLPLRNSKIRSNKND